MTKENKTNDNDDLVVVESKWDFLKKGLPPNLLESSIERVIQFMRSLPFLTEKQKKEFLKTIESLRKEKFKED